MHSLRNYFRNQWYIQYMLLMKMGYYCAIYVCALPAIVPDISISKNSVLFNAFIHSRRDYSRMVPHFRLVNVKYVVYTYICWNKYVLMLRYDARVRTSNWNICQQTLAKLMSHLLPLYSTITLNECLNRVQTYRIEIQNFLDSGKKIWLRVVWLIDDGMHGVKNLTHFTPASVDQLRSWLLKITWIFPHHG